MARPHIEIFALQPGSRELDICAAWRYEAFLKDDGYSLADSHAQLTRIATEPEGCEVALVARLETQVAGICMLVRKELDAAHDLSPWLASLYVAPDVRRRGVARTLVKAIEDHARQNAVDRLHLYTVDAEELYLKCGWSTIERFVAHGTPLVLMIRDL